MEVVTAQILFACFLNVKYELQLDSPFKIGFVLIFKAEKGKLNEKVGHAKCNLIHE